ncbi:MAG TPA: flagellar hook-length control protein FliK, partial [Devosia sp.]|nr:flagellar hook-length control protein FliK [Devosia sp.]
TAFNTEQNWLDEGTANPNLSLAAQTLEIAQGNSGATPLPGAETMLGPALVGVEGSVTKTEVPTQANAPTQVAGQPALLTSALATGIDAISPALVSAPPLPVPLPAGLRGLNTTAPVTAPTAAPTPVATAPIETAPLQSTPLPAGPEPKAPATVPPQPAPGTAGIQFASATKLSAGPTLEFIATRATRAALPAGNGTPAPTLDAMVAGTLVADNTNPGAQATQTTQTAQSTQSAQPDLAATLQRQLTPESQRPQVGGNPNAQKPADGLMPNAPSLAPGTNALALAITPAALTGAQGELMGTISDPALSAQTPGQSAAPLSQSSPAINTPASFTSTLQNAYAQAQINMPNMAVEIARNFAAGNNRFQIRMDPPELGRIDVRLNIDENGTLRARLAVERPETLDLLQRDARALERALADIGFEGTRTNLEFSLKQNPFAGEDSPDNHTPGNNSDPVDANKPADPEAGMVTAIYRGNISPGGLDLLA